MSTRPSNGRSHIQYMSDLHLERIAYNFDLPQAASYLVLGGDIGRFCDYEAYANFLRKQCERFDRVLLLAGNHEYYGFSREDGLAAARKLVDDSIMAGKLTFIDRTRVDLPESDIIVLGCTLQSHIGSDCGRLTNDFRRIKNWTVEKHNAEHNLDLVWLKQSLQSIADTAPDKRVVIVTHYAPSFRNTCHPMQENNEASQCFCSDTLKAFQDWTGSRQVLYWVFGHTHWNTRFKHGHTTVLSNQLCNDSRDLTWWQKHLIYRPFDARAVLKVQ